LDSDSDNDNIKAGREDINFNGAVDKGETKPNEFTRQSLFLLLHLDD
jgi:hypothetical protein